MKSLKIITKPKKEYNASQLWEHVESRHTINCSNCDDSKSVSMLDEDDAIGIFFNSGWRVTESNNCYCPKCAKKKLKP